MNKITETDEEKARLSYAINQASDGVVITDPNKPGNPVIYVNETFTRITGYESHEVLGRNCRFLQGPKTDPHTRFEIHKAVEEKRSVKVAILNYRKNGQPYWNGLRISPVFSQEGKLLYFLGFQADISDRIRM